MGTRLREEEGVRMRMAMGTTHEAWEREEVEVHVVGTKLREEVEVHGYVFFH